MKVVVIGGGPAGLYFALLMKRADPSHQVTVFERNRARDTYGWGVVFSDQTLERFFAADEATAREIQGRFVHWDDIDVHIRGTVVTSSGHGFSGIGRGELLNILQSRAAQVGTDLRFGIDVRDDGDLPSMGLSGADLIVGADGANSSIRSKYAVQFQPSLRRGKSKYIWLGTSRKFEAFTFYIVVNQYGVFQAHCYSFDANAATFIVECDQDSWRNAGFDHMDASATLASCEELFAPWLDGHPLLFNADHQRHAPWLSFLQVHNQKWWYRNLVLIGDAAHTAHFSIGSGTKMAMEDAITLAHVLSSEPTLPAALELYESERRTEALRLQNAARNSMEWFENIKQYVGFEPEQFAYSLLTRSQRVGHENLRIRDSHYVENYERWFATVAGATGGSPAPPMFLPYRLRALELINRVVVSPMDMYSATDGTPSDFHLVHLGSRALGGAGLIVTEMTCVAPDGRITLGCTGMYTPENMLAWRRIVTFVHSFSRSKICVQLGHAGRKGSITLPWEGDDIPLQNGWELIAPSAIPYRESMPVPREMTRQDMEWVCDQFVQSTRMAIEADFDMLELHCAHGYLLSSFITPLSNRRQDEYGGSLENRLRFPLHVFKAMRETWPLERPMSVRISASDWVEGGIEASDSVEVARAFRSVGADIIHVSTGQTSPDAKPVYGRMYQTPFSDRIRNQADVPTIAVGNIIDGDQVNGIIAAGRADLCALARPHLSDPHWTLRAAAMQDYTQQSWPVQYLTGKEQLERETRRSKIAR